MSIKPHGKEVKLEYIKLCLLEYKIETNAKGTIVDIVCK